MKRIAVILSGCGFKDGAEITEAVSTLIHLSEKNVGYTVFAPNFDYPGVDHATDNLLSTLNAMSESARITRGHIKDISVLSADDFDGLVFPGGFGVAKNLCTFASEGASCSVLEGVEKAITDFYQSGRPICAMCIAPALIARVLGKHQPTLTIGEDTETIAEIEKTGAQHEVCAVDDFVSDREHKIITTPAYMYSDAAPHLVFKGIGGAISELVEMA